MYSVLHQKKKKKKEEKKKEKKGTVTPSLETAVVYFKWELPETTQVFVVLAVLRISSAN